MNEQDISFLLKFIAAGTKILSARFAMIFTMLLTFALFSWVMYAPDYWRLGAATIFALLVFIPVIRLDASQAKKPDTEGGK